MKAPGRALVQGTFPALEAALFAQVRELRGAAPPCDRLQPLAVLVPNAMLRLHLSRAVAESGLAHANIHFLTLRHLADRLAGARLATEGRSALRDEAVELGAAAGRAARELESRLEYFRPVAHQEGFHSALLETLRDLKNAGVRPDGMQRAVQRMSARQDGVLRGKLAEVALLWERIERIKDENKLYDEADLLEAAAREAERSSWLKELAQFIVYGFYDLTGAQQRLLAACFPRAPATVYFPFADEPAYRYALPALDWFRGQGFEPRKAPVRSAPATRPAGKPAAVPDDVFIISAPGEAREVAEVAREVLHRPPSAGLPAGRVAGAPRIGILLRSPGPYVELLHEAFASAQVRAHFAKDAAPPLSRTPAGRALENLAGLAGGPLRRAEVMDFLAGAPLQPAGSLFDAPPVAEWNAITIAAGIVEGRRQWESRLGNAVRGASSGETAAFAAAMPAFRAFLKRLFDGLEKIAAQPKWSGRMTALTELYRALIVADDAAEEALAALDTLSGFDALGEPPAPERFRARVRDLLADARPAIGAFERNEPAVVRLMAARGVPFDLVIVPGLVEKSFPQPARQDPILLDAERQQLAAQLARAGSPADIPLKARRRDEEELLFALAVQSARRRLVLTYPRLDAATARERVPSHFLLRMLETLSGQAPDYRDLDQFIRLHGRFVHTTRFDPEARDGAVTELEYDLAAFGKVEHDRAPGALLYFLNDERRFFARAMEAESARWGNADFSRYDGVVQSPGLARALGKRLYDESRPVSPTRLEDYAQCPFSYLLKHVFGLEAADEPERAATLSPQDRGSLVHEVLRQFLSEAARAGTLPLTEAHWPRLQAVALERFGEFERRGVTGYPMLWRIEQARLLEDLREFLDLEIAGRSSFSPAHFEVRFGMPARDEQESRASTRKPALLEVAPGAPIRFCGKIDRVDVDPAARRCRVLDYKTGANYLRLQNDSFHGGRALQLPIYLIAARLVFPDLEAEYAEYYYASRRGDWRKVRFTTEGWPEKAKTLQRIVRTILDGIRAGRFFPAPVEADCDRCEFRLACGHGRFLDFKWAADTQTTADFNAMAEIP
ncbi:MAG: PD-(D/E)XK nuclease family protein [Candidatus Brocadiia bacterium]